MNPVNFTGIVKRVLVAIVGALSLSVPAQAATITLDFSGTVDLSSEGGPSSNTFSGSITWDPAALPIPSDPGDPTETTYDPVSYTLFFNGVDETAPVIGDGTGSGVVVLNDSDFLSPGVPQDAFAFFLAFRPSFQLNGQDGDLAVVGVLEGPTTMFTSTALPGNLDFLGQVTSTYSLWVFEPDGGDDAFLDVRGTLVVSPSEVPEPTTLALTMFGVAGVLARVRSARRSPNAS